MVGQTISHYKITEKLGEGGMGVVWKAEDTRLERPVALKFLTAQLLEDGEARKRFTREAIAAAALDHPNICTIHEIDETEGQTFLAMAYVEGQSVKDKVKDRPLNLDEALGIAIQTAQGLQAAHEKGIVHRDIKSANLMVTRQGQVKILDFGLAQLAERSHLTQTATILGTPAYMSPEQAQRRPTDRRTDIWSLGVVIYEMVAGRLPFEAEREEAVAYSIVHEQPEPLTAQRVDVPVELDRLVGKAMAKEAGERYQHVEDMLVDLRTLRRQLDAGSTAMAAAASAATLTHSQGQPMKTRSGGFEWLKALPWALAFLLLLILSLTYFREPQSEDRPAVRRFTIAPEASGAGVYSRAAAQSIPPAAAISPDGSTIAYASAERPSRLWLHDLSSGKSRPIAGTEYGHPNELPSDDFFGIRPFWSPNRDTVGFFTSHSLKKFSLIDEGITTLHTLQGSDARYAGGAWSPDGNTIVFAAGAGGGTRLFAVPASGGEVRTVPVSLGGLMGYPAFVASGEPAVMFQSFRDLHVVRISDGETALLIAEGRNPVYSPTGHVIFDRAGSTWAVPFSLTTLKPAGEAFLVESGFSIAGVSQDGTLLCVTSQALRDRFQLTIRNRQGTLIGRVGPPLFGASHPAVSPDGEKVAVAASRQPGVSGDIWIFDVEGQGSLRLTTDPRDEHQPIWTRDGGRILFRTQSDSDRDADFFITDAVGGGSIETFLDNDSRLAEPAFSPDGGMFIFQDVPLDGTQFDIRFLELRNAGEQTEPVAWLDSQFNESHPQFSPNGKYVAYSSNESGRSQIHVRPFPAGSPVWQVSRDGGGAPRWSPDGSELYWWDDGGGFPLMAAKMDFARSNPVGEVEEVFSTGRGAFTFLYDVMPDGRFVILEPIEEEGSQTPRPIYMLVVQNWYEEFRNHGQN